MALWPFRRKSRRKRSSRGAPPEFQDARGRPSEPLPVLRSQTGPETAAVAGSNRAHQTKEAHQPNRLQRRVRTYSFSPGRNDSIRIERKRSTKARQGRGSQPALAAGANPTAGLNSTYVDDDGDKVDSGVDALGDDVFYRVPTLHNKRDGDPLPRKKSSKKRRKDGLREAEIKAMSNFVPLRPATDDWHAGRPLRKETRRVRTGGFGFGGRDSREWDRDNRSSDISLPTHASVDSAMSSDSEHISFKVGVFEALAPRPTLRVASFPHTWTSSGGGLGRRPTERRKLSEKEPINEATLKAHKRVDALADDLSASDLRELMERDSRRRERKRQKEQEKIERRLTRQAEKQRAAEAQAAAEGRDSPPNMERGVLGREQIGLGIDPASAVVTSSRRRRSDASPPKQLQHAEGDEPMDEDRPRPLEAFHRTDSIAVDDAPALHEYEEPMPEPVPVPVPVPVQAPSPTSKGLLRSKKSRSKSPPLSEMKTEALETPRKGSDGTGARGPLSWTSFFRWGKNKRTSSGGPSSFSNTSRDSMQTSQVLPVPAPVAPRRMSSGVPKRTMSRFREDLPELPLSPPDSRIQSPADQDPIPPTIAEASPDIDAQVQGFTFTQTTQTARHDTPTSAIDIVRNTSTTPSHPEEQGVSPEPGQAMSLASVDSEGSWLSGRLGKRRSSGFPRNSTPILHFAHRESASDEHDTANEDVSIADDEYLSRFARSSNAGWNRKSTGEARPSSDEEEDARWGSVPGAQHPTVVHTADRMKSREGLLNSYGEEGEVDEDSYVDEDIVEAGGLQRATSINLGKGHAKHVSAGSAKLLNITPRDSVDKRRSISPRPEGS